MPRRGESIYKRKDGRWEARYVKEIKSDGTKKYGSVYAESYKEVKEKRQIVKNNLPDFLRTRFRCIENWYHLQCISRIDVIN